MGKVTRIIDAVRDVNKERLHFAAAPRPGGEARAQSAFAFVGSAPMGKRRIGSFAGALVISLMRGGWPFAHGVGFQTGGR